MIALAVLILMVVAVVALSWAWRDKPKHVTCCNRGPWPPDDISARPGAHGS